MRQKARRVVVGGLRYSDKIEYLRGLLENESVGIDDDIQILRADIPLFRTTYHPVVRIYLPHKTMKEYYHVILKIAAKEPKAYFSIKMNEYTGVRIYLEQINALECLEEMLDWETFIQK